MTDVEKKDQKWFYTEDVKEHFFNPRNILKTEAELAEYEKEADGIGEMGNAACGDVMKMMIKVEDGRIIDCKWQTFGCASAIASTSMLSVMITENGGMLREDAMKLTAQDILKRLGGLPQIKVHCSVLGDRALKAAIEDYKNK